MSMQRPLFSEAARRVARVALPLPVDALFDYAVPDELAEAAQPGCRALVSFSGRRLTGVIVESNPHDASESRRRLASLERIVDGEPALSGEMLGCLIQAAKDVHCPLGLALATALPPGSAPRIVRHIGLTRRGSEALRARAVRGAAHSLLAKLAAGPRPAPSLEAEAGTRALLAELEADGLIERADLEARPSARPGSRRVASPTPDLDVETTCREALGRSPKQAALLARIARGAPVPIADLRAENPGAARLLRVLVKRGFVQIAEIEAPSNVLGASVPRDRAADLTREQAEALAPISSAVHDRRSETFLLHGVTGSGKTEVYLRAIAEALDLGRQALVLVPEITLTHQIVARLRARFGDQLAVLHSGLRRGERLEQWQRLRSGQSPIAVGARSALFAPLERLGVIAIDEEHDSAYKNEEGFRYHARDLARLRAAAAGCPLILGSATPSLESRYAADRGEMRRLVLARRIGGRPLPRVEIVDLSREPRVRGRKLILTPKLRRALLETLDQGDQSILFLNRRGFSTQIYCFECGFAERCKDCDVALVYHATEERLRCHYCDWSKPPPELCGGCGVPDTALLGVGTERLEEAVRSIAPAARIARLDRDTAQRRGYTESVLRALHERAVDILIGTQLVAKGHDFPGVRLVGVIAADLGLHLPDFRAAERTFQLLTQVAGRAGRASTPGRVILQTFLPDHYAIRCAIGHDYEAFYEQELEHRAALGYPPFGRLVHVLISGEEEGQTRTAADEVKRSVWPPPDRAFEVLGPAPAPLPRLRGRYRFQILVKGPDRAAIDGAARALIAACARLPASLRASVDANPISML